MGPQRFVISFRLGFAWTLAAATVAPAGAGDPPWPEGAREVYYGHYLPHDCERLGCHATVEKIAWAETRESAFWRARVTAEPVATVDELVEKLRRELKGITVVRADTKPVVIHLIETPLADREGYPLDRTIDLAFSGSLGRLLDRLKERVGVGRTTGGGGIPMLHFNDQQTRVAVDVKGGTVRDVLTQAVLRLDYSPILWEAETHDDGRGTEVRFDGPRAWAESGPPIPPQDDPVEAERPPAGR